MGKSTGFRNPSNFAKFCLSYLKPKKILFDLGCGNYRDTNFFKKHNIKALGIDKQENLDFETLTKLSISGIDYVYLRWSIHAIKRTLADKLLKWCYNSLNRNGYIFIEVRSINDDLYGRGKQVDRDGFVYDHYRRFIRKRELEKTIEALGFRIIHCVEGRNFSKIKGNNPCLIRLIAQKSGIHQ